MKTPKFVKTPVSEIQAVKSTGNYTVILDNWWIVTPEGEVLLYRGVSPQANRNKVIAESVRAKLYPECSLLQIPMAYVPLDVRDY